MLLFLTKFSLRLAYQPPQLPSCSLSAAALPSVRPQKPIHLTTCLPRSHHPQLSVKQYLEVTCSSPGENLGVFIQLVSGVKRWRTDRNLACGGNDRKWAVRGGSVRGGVCVLPETSGEPVREISYLVH